MDATLLDRFAALDSAAVSDALDKAGLPSGVGGLAPRTAAGPVVGFARTVALEPHRGGPPKAHILTATVDAAGELDVIVIDNDGRTDVSCWGGILALGAAARGVRGIIADGACRDVAEIRELGLPVYSRGTVPATARGRLQQRSAGEPVTIAGRTVCQGDIVMADETGLVVVPADRAREVVELAEAVAVREQAIAAEVRAGSPLAQAMHDARLAGERGAEA
jgi:regulator of RNase E activity RraA